MGKLKFKEFNPKKEYTLGDEAEALVLMIQELKDKIIKLEQAWAH